MIPSRAQTQHPVPLGSCPMVTSRSVASHSPPPSPDEVRVETERRHPSNPRNGYSPLPVHYPHLGLTVKYGERVVISEGQCLWAIRRLFGSAVPVPEVYGWVVDQGVVFVYMEHIPGETLENRWDQLSEPERLDICRQLRLMIGRIRSLEQEPGNCFIGEERLTTSELVAHDSL